MIFILFFNILMVILIYFDLLNTNSFSKFSYHNIEQNGVKKTKTIILRIFIIL